MAGPNTPYFYRSGGGSGSGSSSGTGKNYLTTYKASTGSGAANPGNGDLELGATTNFSLGNVGTLTNGIPTGTSPTFGSGFNGNLSLAIASTNTLGGLYSMDLVSLSATTAGDCVATAAFNIDAEDQAKVLAFKIAYKAQASPSNGNWSGTSSNSFAVAVWDATNSVFLGTAGQFNFTQSSGIGYCTGTCQMGATTASVRLLIYNANASANAITLRTDDWFFGPQITANGPAMSDPVSVTMTTGGWVDANHTTTALESRSGKFAYYDVLIAITGTPTTASLTINLPAGRTIDTAAVTKSVANSEELEGSNCLIVAAGAAKIGKVLYNNTTSVSLYAESLSTFSGTQYFNYSTVTQAVPGTFANNDFIRCTFRVPIVGWSSNTSMSSDTDTRVVAARMTGATATITGSYSDITWTTIANDTHGAMGAISYTAPVTGYYDITGAINVGAASLSAAGGFFIGLNTGSIILENQFVFDLNVPENESLDFNYGSVLLNAGTTLKLQVKTTGTVGTPVINSSATTNFLAIRRSSGPAVIAATESVNMKYVNTAGTSMSNSGENNVPFATKVFDSHSGFSGTVYTCPTSGKFRVSGTVTFASALYAAGNQVQASVYKNGVLESEGMLMDAWAAVTIGTNSTVSTTVSCNAGDTLEVRVLNNRTAGATTLQTLGGYNHIEIERVGN